MIITDNKITVTYAMMAAASMTRHGDFGIPVDLENLPRGLRWKSLADLTLEDLDTLEAYFLRKQAQAAGTGV
jgi:hypothetical protein